MPLLIILSIDIRFSLIVSPLEPVRGKDSAAVCAGAAETALGSLGEDHPSVPADCEGLAGGVYAWEDGAAEDVVDAGLAVHSLAVVLGVVELLAANVECLFVADDRLEDRDLVGVVECWWGEGEAKEEAEQHCDDSQHNKYIVDTLL